MLCMRWSAGIIFHWTNNFKEQIQSTKNKKTKMFVPKGAQHDQHPTNQAVAKLGTVLGAQ